MKGLGIWFLLQYKVFFSNKDIILAIKIRQTEGSRRTVSSSLFSLYLYDAQRHTERRFSKSTIASGIDSVISSDFLYNFWLKKDSLWLISQFSLAKTKLLLGWFQYLLISILISWILLEHQNFTTNQLFETNRNVWHKVLFSFPKFYFKKITHSKSYTWNT